MAKQITSGRKSANGWAYIPDHESDSYITIQDNDMTAVAIDMNYESFPGLAVTRNAAGIKQEYNGNEDLVSDLGGSPAQGSPESMSLIVKLAVVQPFPLMRLPPEIRIMVYKEILIQPGPIEIYGKPTLWARAFRPSSRLEGQDGDNDSQDNDEDDDDSLNQRIYGEGISQALVSRLFRTSRTVYRESALLYFRHNIFQFHEVDSIVSFVNVLPPYFRRAIKSMVITYNGNKAAMAAKALKTCLGLQHLRLHFNPGSIVLIRHWRMPYFRGWEHLWGLKDLLKIRGIKELQITKSNHIPVIVNVDDYFEDWQAFSEALQVLKEPQTKQHLTRQNKKDFPQQSMREVFNLTNVATRAQSRLEKES